MKTLIQILVLSILSFSTIAQQASEIDPKFVKLPRYANLTAITTAITAPTQGMLVYNIGTASNWYFNGTAWTNTAGSLALPFSQSVFYSGGPLFYLNKTDNGSTEILDLQMTNASSNGDVIYARTYGLGRVGVFSISNISNPNNVFQAFTNGSGSAGNFAIGNVLNSSPAIFASTSGTGKAFEAINTSITNATINAVNNNNLGNALNVTGGIKVSGTNPAAFKITTNTGIGGNTSGNNLIIPNTTLANNANDILIVTHNFSPNNTYLNKAYGVFWNGSNWAIFLEDLSTMTNSIIFNVLVIKQ
jgi:hypothetical protein